MSGDGDTAEMLQPGQNIRPNVSLDLAKKLVLQYYGYEVSRVKELNSYDDNNFFLEATDRDGNDGKYILKVLNSIDSKKTGHVQSENEAMLFLTQNGINCPIPQKNLEGNTFGVVDIPGEGSKTGSRNVIRLLTFVEGKILYEFKPNSKLLFKTGAYIAQIDNLLTKFHHPALESHNSNWQMRNSLELRKFMYVIKDNPGRYEMVKSVLDAFEERVIPALPNLAAGVIHGDYNEQNIIVRSTPGNDGDEYEIHGVIDFGDLNKSCYVFEVAIMLCYMMLECVRTGELDPLVGSGYIVAGYNKFRKIPQNELDLLRLLIAARLCQSVVMGAYTYSLNPGNEYLLITAKTGWTFLNKIWNDTTDEQLQTIWKEAMNS